MKGDSSTWSSSIIPQHLESLSFLTRQQYASRWLEQARSEHASVASFALLVQKLLAVSAPPELVLEACDCAREEIEHAKLSYALASAYSGSPKDPGSYDPHVVAVNPDLNDLVVTTIKEGCIAETISALEAKQESEEQDLDPVLKKVFEQLAKEEAHHSAFAYKVVKWAIEKELDQGNQALFDLAHSTFTSELQRVKSSCSTEFFSCLVAFKDNLFQSFLQENGTVSPSSYNVLDWPTGQDFFLKKTI